MTLDTYIQTCVCMLQSEIFQKTIHTYIQTCVCVCHNQAL